jgi:hypothetical protein
MSDNTDIPSLKTLKNIKTLKQENKAAIYDIVLGRCSEKIIETNKQTDNTFLFFELPKVIIGYPNYNLRDCGEYIVKKFIEKGYSSKLVKNSDFVYIDWSDSLREPSKNGNCSFSKNVNSCDQNNLKDVSLPSSTMVGKVLKKYPNVDSSQVVFVYTDDKGPVKKRKVKKKK